MCEWQCLGQMEWMILVLLGINSFLESFKHLSEQEYSDWIGTKEWMQLLQTDIVILTHLNKEAIYLNL